MLTGVKLEFYMNHTQQSVLKYLTSEMFLKATGTYCKPMKNWQKLLKIHQYWHLDTTET